jgi:hypothetical protein
MPPGDIRIFARRLALAVGFTAASAVSVLVSLGLTHEADGASPIWIANSFI